MCATRPTSTQTHSNLGLLDEGTATFVPPRGSGLANRDFSLRVHEGQHAATCRVAVPPCSGQWTLSFEVAFGGRGRVFLKKLSNASGRVEGGHLNYLYALDVDGHPVETFSVSV